MKEVILYGSLAHGNFKADSDIDLFVIGFTGDYWRAYVEAERIASPFNIDLVCEEDAYTSLKELVRQQGVWL